MQVREESKKVRVSHIWAYAHRLTESTRLYALPLPNISGSKICTGPARIPVGDNLLQAIETAFLDTPFNHHQQIVSNKKIPFEKYYKWVHKNHDGELPIKSLIKMELAKEILDAPKEIHNWRL